MEQYKVSVPSDAGGTLVQHFESESRVAECVKNFRLHHPSAHHEPLVERVEKPVFFTPDGPVMYGPPLPARPTLDSMIDEILFGMPGGPGGVPNE